MSNAVNLTFEIFKMIRSGIKILAVMLLSTAVVSCASLRPRQKVENPELANVKFAFVTADEGLPQPVIGNVQSQLSASIASTHRNVVTDPVYLTVRVSSIGVQQGTKAPVYTVMLNTILSDARDGHVVSSSDLQAYATVPKGKSLNDQIAGAITARLRMTYNLAQPEQPKVAIAMPPKTSTQIAIEQPDALLNASTKIEPVDPLMAKPAVILNDPKPVTPAPVAQAPVASAVVKVSPNFIGPVLPANAASSLKPTNPPASAQAKADAKAEPSAATVVVPAKSNLENGAVSKIVIPAAKTPAPATPAAVASDEPCVVTPTNDCSTPQ
jgi:hypothetical protein